MQEKLDVGGHEISLESEDLVIKIKLKVMQQIKITSKTNVKNNSTKSAIPHFLCSILKLHISYFKRVFFQEI